MKNGKIKVNVLNTLMFLFLTFMIFFSASLIYNIEIVETKSADTISTYYKNSFWVLLTNMHNDLVTKVDNKQVDAKNVQALANWMTRYTTQATYITEKAQMYLLDGKTKQVIYPAGSQFKYNDPDYISEEIEIPLLPSNGNYYFIAHCRIKKIYVIPLDVCQGIEKIKQKVLITIWTNIILYIIFMICVGWSVKKNIKNK